MHSSISDPALDALLRRSDALLGQPTGAVTDKPAPSSSGDAHDFFSIGRYCWPNPQTPDGMPWIRIDCEVNQDSYSERFDLTRYKAMVESVVTLALAYRHTSDERYAAGATTRLTRWFLDPATAMNPHLEHAAALPGVHDGTYYGIIQGAVMIRLPYAAALLSPSVSWTATADRDLRDWFARYTNWLEISPFGTEQAGGKNNNTLIWYHAQRVVFGHYAGAQASAEDGLRSIGACLDVQIAPDGTLPAELARPESWIYSVYCLTGVASAAELGGLHGIDIWHHTTQDGRTLRSCFDLLAPYLRHERPWPWPAKTDALPDQALWLYRLAASAYDDSTYLDVAAHVANAVTGPEIHLVADLYDPLFAPFRQG